MITPPGLPPPASTNDADRRWRTIALLLVAAGVVLLVVIVTPDDEASALCDARRSQVVQAKQVRQQGQVANAYAEDTGQPPVLTEAEMESLRGTVHDAARAARSAGCNIDDLVGPGVGR